MQWSACADALRAQGLAVVAITSEPPDATRVMERLLARGVADLEFPVVSDPNMRLCEDDGIFTKFLKPASEYNRLTQYEGDRSDYVDYWMVQPALVTVDTNGNVVNWWSWKAMGLTSDWAVAGADPGRETVPHPCSGKPVKLVTLRPVPEDLPAAISERRCVRVEQIGQAAVDQQLKQLAALREAAAGK